MSEIRQMVSREARARYDEERVLAKRELLILRPEARIDLLLEEAAPDIEAKALPKTKPARISPPIVDEALEAAAFGIRLQEALGVSEPEALEALIRKVLREEMAAFGG
ncbi:MAG: hypothetical protein L3J37_06860 [Rhodobacteraceae bacterium]|nr:hypothetical protein [Paracoccaceae bacterium]